MDSRALLDELVCLPLIGGGGTTLRAFCLSPLWQIYETMCLLRVEECRLITPSRGAGLMVLSMGGKGHSLICLLGPQTQLFY
jgi:hypothetical protein